VNSWKVIFAIVFTTVVIFGAGVFTGGVLVNHSNHWRQSQKPPRRPEATSPSPASLSSTNGQAPQASRPPRLPEILNKQFLQRLDEELHLTQDQREAIQKIITEGQNQMRKTMMDARLEIREQLTPEQRSQFDELVKRPIRRMPNSTNAPPVSVAPTNVPAN
jgi:Spy/CpxP family protein refolding chaperone